MTRFSCWEEPSGISWYALCKLSTSASISASLRLASASLFAWSSALFLVAIFDVLFLHFEGFELECSFCDLMSFGVFSVVKQVSMRDSFIVDVFYLWVGSFVLRLRAVENAARLSGGACGASGGFLLRWGHRGLSFVLERWAPLLGS